VRYVCGPSLKGQSEVDWTNPQARQRFLAEIVADADQLLELVRGTRAGLAQDSAEDDFGNLLSAGWNEPG
jgi:hypothetical protein